MKVLIDTNVILDVWLRRREFSANSTLVVAAAENREFRAYVCATSVTTLYFLSGRGIGRSAALRQITTLLTFCEVALVDRAILSSAAASPMPDFEDAVIAEAAKAANMDAIVTRDAKGFRKSGIHVYSPQALLAELNVKKGKRNGE